MTLESDEVAYRSRRLVAIQTGIGFLVALGFGFYAGPHAAISAFLGAFGSMISTLILGSGVEKASEQAIENPGKSMGMLYLGAVKRFLFVIVYFIAGIKLAELDPLALAVGFALAQLSFVFGIKERAKN